ncbi:MAG: hypothetical protein DVB31_11310 [Verrucomicrobia bacterium]|nr:MAG: hypothetical protein DVB31_11310 [Verrucomicrobiota bacterium]
MFTLLEAADRTGRKPAGGPCPELVFLLWMAAAWIANPTRAQSGPAAGTPVIRVNGTVPAGGVVSMFAGEVAPVTLSSDFPDALIFYTLDGSEPDLSIGLDYGVTGPFNVTAPATVRAIAYPGDFSNVSDVAEVRLGLVSRHVLTDRTFGGGGVSASPSAADYPHGMVVTLTATNLEGWQFLRWEGDVTGATATTSVVMDADKSFRAVFGTTVSTTVTGLGTVTLEPATGPYAYGSLVRLMAVPTPGRTFARWTNLGVPTNGLITAVMTNPTPAFRAIFGAGVPAGKGTLSLKVSGGERSSGFPRISPMSWEPWSNSDRMPTRVGYSMVGPGTPRAFRTR